MVQWLRRVPGQQATWEHLRIDESDFIWHDFRGEEVRVKHRVCVSGMPDWFRMMCYICVVLPKFAIELAILYYGSGYVAISANAEIVILNCVALVFVTQIDETLYAYGVSYNIRHILEAGLTEISVSSEEWD